MANNKPTVVFKAGAVRASIFTNTFIKDGKTIPLPKVVLEVRYRDKNGEWKGTNSLSQNEIPKAILALQKAFDFLTSQPRQLESDTTSGTQQSESPARVPAES